jgi:S1-C subfamily serine protease
LKRFAKKAKNTKSFFETKKFWLFSIAWVFLVLGSMAYVFSLMEVSSVYPKTAAEAASVSVTVLNSHMTGGGTGVILSSSKNKSLVLTNAHVCKVVENGGIVITDNGAKHSVSGYKISKQHDLCIIQVSANLGYDTHIASESPKNYEDAMISGHPNLLPTVVSYGHFSGHLVIEVITDIRPCKEEDFKKEPLICLFFGGIPVLTSYQSRLVTATIQAGSSGSAVYNSDGEISGLVFAGSGDISYAFVVPYEAVSNFVEKEQHSLDFKKPNNTSEPGKKRKSKGKSIQEITENCRSKPEAVNVPEISEICQIFNSGWVKDFD